MARANLEWLLGSSQGLSLISCLRGRRGSCGGGRARQAGGRGWGLPTKQATHPPGHTGWQPALPSTGPGQVGGQAVVGRPHLISRSPLNASLPVLPGVCPCPQPSRLGPQLPLWTPGSPCQALHPGTTVQRHRPTAAGCTALRVAGVGGSLWVCTELSQRGPETRAAK